MRRALVLAAAVGATFLAASSAPAATPVPPRVIRVVLEESRISPAVIPLKSGERVRLEVRNAGTMPHEFRSTVFRGVDVWVRAGGFDLRAERLEVVVVRPGATVVLEFARRTPGEYPFWCGISTADGRRHRDLGMTGRFVVSP